MNEHSISDADSREHLKGNPELDTLKEEFDAIEEDFHRLIESLSDSQLNWRPEAKRWSIGECIDHLSVTGNRYLPLLEKSITDARARGLLGRGSTRHPFLGRWFVRIHEPPPRLRLKAPKIFRPEVGTLAVAALKPSFCGLQNEFRKLLIAAQGVDLGRARVISPITSLIRLSLGQAFALMAAHERRHLWQAWNVRREEEFPT